MAAGSVIARLIVVRPVCLPYHTLEYLISAHGAETWPRHEFREILFESCYAVHFSLSRNFVRKLICWPFPFSRNFVRKLIAGPPVREGHRTGP